MTLIAQIADGTLANVADAQTALATTSRAGRSRTSRHSPRAIGAVFPADYQHPETHDTLRQLQAMALAAGGTAAQIVGWGAVPADEPAAEAMAATARLAAKRHPNNDVIGWRLRRTSWIPSASGGAQRPCRRTCRDCATASGNLIYGDANGLFDHFLIDVQMSSCEVTTRVIQAYIAVQIFVERCRMNLEGPAVTVDPALDDTWDEWEWMSRYRIWEANREVFLYPENWLIESQRPNRTENYRKLEQEVRQGESTPDYLETVVLNATSTGSMASLILSFTSPELARIRRRARCTWSAARPWSILRVFYLALAHRRRVDRLGADPDRHQGPPRRVPAMYGGIACASSGLRSRYLNEPHQQVAAGGAAVVERQRARRFPRYVDAPASFSAIFRNGKHGPPAQSAKGKLFDKPLHRFQHPSAIRKSTEALYTIKVQTRCAFAWL